jgi:copper transport protein
VVIVRLAGHAAFPLFAGVAAFVILCAPGSSKNSTLQLLARVGLLGGAVAAVAAILVQGAYTAGVSMGHAWNRRLLRETLATPFGTAMMWRLGLYGVLGLLAWRLPRIHNQLAAGWCQPI